jgi:hypothetical protein
VGCCLGHRYASAAGFARNLPLRPRV